jgi:glycosyltransferase involved in cell wall biosynthesis
MTDAAPDDDRDDRHVRDLGWFVDDLIDRGIRRVHVLAWRDLDDDDAGGSEVHADQFMRRWAENGIDVTHRTSKAIGRPSSEERNGYRVIRRGSRYTVFPRAIGSELIRRMGPYDALIEIWNGVPWFSPLWCRRPRLTVIHHVHGPMWDQLFSGPVAAAGKLVETRLAPRIYRRGLTVAPSDGTRDQLLALGFRAPRVKAIPNGVDAAFTPGGSKSERPSIVAVARLAPVKRFDVVIRAAVAAKGSVPELELTIVGEGAMRVELESLVSSLGATDWIRFRGRIPQADLIDEYRRSWIVVSASLAEGWGLSLTEGSACGTPAVATDIRGHRSSVIADETGVLAEPNDLGGAMVNVLTNPALRQRLSAAALERAQSLTWDATALGITGALHGEVVRSQER